MPLAFWWGGLRSWLVFRLTLSLMHTWPAVLIGFMGVVLALLSDGMTLYLMLTAWLPWLLGG